MKKLRGFFSSLILTVVLAILICLVAAVGSIITIRNPAIMSYLDHKVLIYGLGELSGRPEIYWIILLTALIALFAINTFVCTLEKISAIVKNHLPWQKLLPQVVHIGFLIALVGHLAGSVAGFKSTGNVIFNGEATPVAAVKGLSVRLDDFTASNDELGYRDFMKTTVTLFRGDEKILTGDISINHPLIYKGIAFYYNDDGKTPTGIKILREGVMEELSFEGRPASAKAGALKITGFYPDFAIDSGGSPISRSDRFINPYVRLTMKGDSAFLSIQDQGSSVSLRDETIRFAGFSLRPYVVLTINKDPGIWLVISGSLILLAGMILLLIFGGDKRELIRPARLNKGAVLSES